MLDTADLSDSSGPAQAAETIILIYYPYRERQKDAAATRCPYKREPQ